MNEPLLQIRDLQVRFRADSDRPLEAVRGVDLDVGAGERVAVVGESGSGKTVTMLAVLGLLGPGAKATGSVRFAGEELLEAPPGRLRQIRGNRIGMIFQDPLTSLNPAHTVRHQLAEAFLAHHPRSKRAPPCGPASCSSWSRSPTSSGGCGRTRTSCPAACASG